MGSRARLGLLAVTVLAAIVLSLVLRPDGEEPTPVRRHPERDDHLGRDRD